MTSLRAVPPTIWIVLGNLCIVLPLAVILNVWQDEAYSLLTTGTTLSHTIHQAIFFEQNAPLYFVALWSWRQASASYFWARMLSVACTTALIALVPALMRRYAPSISAIWATLVVAFNPLTIWAAVEIRSYAAAMLLGALVMLTGYDAFLAGTRRWYPWVGFVAIGALCAYTQYFLLFLIAGLGIVLALRRLWGGLLRYLIAGAAILALFIPELIVLPAQISAFRTAYVGPANILQSLETLGKILFFQLFPISRFSYRTELLVAIAAVLLIGIALSRKKWVGGGPSDALALLLATAVVYAAAVYTLKTHFDYRYGAFLFAPLIVALFSSLRWWGEPARRFATIGLAILLLTLSAAALADRYRAGAKIGDWRRVAAYLDSAVSTGQPILVFQAENVVPLSYYYRGPGRIVALPHAVDFRSYDVDRFVVRTPDDVRATIRRLGDPPELWLVMAGACYSLNVRYGCDVVRAYVATHYRTLEERDFYYASVRLLRRDDSAGAKPNPF